MFSIKFCESSPKVNVYNSYHSKNMFAVMEIIEMSILLIKLGHGIKNVFQKKLTLQLLP